MNPVFPNNTINQVSFFPTQLRPPSISNNQKIQNLFPEALTKSKLNEETKIDKASKVCEVCKKLKSKYKCPNCKIKTCSLSCCKKHKIEQKCNGKQNVTKFINKTEMKEKTLLNDLKYLQSAMTSIEGIKRRLSLVTPNNSQSKRFKQLRMFAQKNDKILVKIKPWFFKNHLQNKSFYFHNQKCIYWTVEFNVYIGNQKFCPFLFDQPKQESLSIKELFLEANFFDEQMIEKFGSKITSKEQLASLLEQDQFSFYLKVIQNQNFQQLQTYEQLTKTNSKCVLRKLKFNESLKQNLQNSLIEEYPFIIVIFQEDFDKFKQEFKYS